MTIAKQVEKALEIDPSEVPGHLRKTRELENIREAFGRLAEVLYHHDEVDLSNADVEYIMGVGSDRKDP